MDLRSSSITADILNILSDGKVHTAIDIAEEIEVNERTVRRHIQSLSYRYPIDTFRGGDKKGGVYLDTRYIQQGKTLTNDELQVINKALALLQKSKSEDVNPKMITDLMIRFALPKEEQGNEEK